MQTLIPEIAEHRVILSNISWETFEQILKELGDKRSTRLAYNNGLLEIMTPLGPHENNNRFIDDLVRAITDELNLNMKKFGSLTMKRSKKLRRCIMEGGIRVSFDAMPRLSIHSNP